MINIDNNQTTMEARQNDLSSNLSFVYGEARRRVNACNARSTFCNLCLSCSSIKSPFSSNFWGGSAALTKNSGLLMKWMSRKTPIWRRWYCPLLLLACTLTIAAGLSAQALGGLDAQSNAFFIVADRTKYIGTIG